jgi:hypothetical protein
MTQIRNPHQLLLVKQLYEDARLLAEREDSFSHTKAVIFIDLAVETLLNSIVLSFDPDLSINASKGSLDTDRRTLWGNASTALNKVKKKRLPESREMASLHALRNLVQHNGTEPTKTEVKRYLSAAEVLMKAAFTEAYDIDFLNFRWWDVITNVDLRQLLRESEYALEKGRPDICMVGCKYAHELIVSAIREATKIRRTRISSVFSGGAGRAGSYTSPPVGIPTAVTAQVRQAANQIDRMLRAAEAKLRSEIIKELDFIEDEVVTVGLGMPSIDTRRFQKIGSAVLHSVAEGGAMQIRRVGRDSDAEQLQEGARFMLNYVARLIRLIDESYPDILAEVKVPGQLSRQKFWAVVDAQEPEESS